MINRHSLRSTAFSGIFIAALLPISQAFAELPGYCEIEPPQNVSLLVRPAANEPPITDINWFARPVPNPDNDWIIGYAMYNENYLYNLTTGDRVRIPDKSDAVATPDGKYMTVPSFYTPDGYVRFYDNAVLLDHLARGQDASEVEPVYIHENESVRQAYYQSLGHLEGKTDGNTETDIYRMIFSGTMHESGFRMVDYTFTRTDGKVSVSPGPAMLLCPEIANDLNTPFISKDGHYLAAYTSPIEKPQYAEGASLKIYRIADASGERASCEEVVDFGFAAGKADFSFDDSALTFHISNVNYLTVFVSGGEVFGDSDESGPLSTDVVVAELTRDDGGVINGVGGIRRLTTASEIGAGNYFPAYLPDGKLFYISHVQQDLVEDRRFEIRVVDPVANGYGPNLFSDEEAVAGAQAIGKLWTQSCRAESAYEYQGHELPWFLFAMTAAQCSDLVH
ncbi:MAG: hypothetical protein ACR2QR_08360, partial [Woeseiaceae bacterium]